MTSKDIGIHRATFAEVGGLLLPMSDLQWWGGRYVTLECEYNRNKRCYPDLRVFGEQAEKLSWLPTRTPVLLSGHIYTYEGTSEKGRRYRGWRLDVDKVLSERSTSPVEEASVDQNMVELTGTVLDIKKMTRSRRKVLLLCSKEDEERRAPEVVMFKGTLDDLAKGMNVSLMGYINTYTITNPKTKKPYTHRTITAVVASVV